MSEQTALGHFLNFACDMIVFQFLQHWICLILVTAMCARRISIYELITALKLLLRSGIGAIAMARVGTNLRCHARVLIGILLMRCLSEGAARCLHVRYSNALALRQIIQIGAT